MAPAESSGTRPLNGSVRQSVAMVNVSISAFVIYLCLYSLIFVAQSIQPQGYLCTNKAEIITMRHFAFLIILLFGASLGVRADDQGPVEKTGQTVEKAATKTGKTVEHAASATGQTVKHGTQATERTVCKGLKKTGNTLEKAGAGVTGSSRHHAKTKGSPAKASPTPSPKPESSPVATPSATPVEPSPTPVETAPTPTPTPSR